MVRVKVLTADGKSESLDDRCHEVLLKELKMCHTSVFVANRNIIGITTNFSVTDLNNLRSSCECSKWTVQKKIIITCCSIRLTGSTDNLASQLKLHAQRLGCYYNPPRMFVQEWHAWLYSW